MLDDLDEAVEELGDPSDLWLWRYEGCSTVPVIVRCIAHHTDEGSTYSMGDYSDGGFSFNREFFELVCSRDEYIEAWRNR